MASVNIISDILIKHTFLINKKRQDIVCMWLVLAVCAVCTEWQFQQVIFGLCTRWITIYLRTRWSKVAILFLDLSIYKKIYIEVNK